jgi:hypothetical protein
MSDLLVFRDLSMITDTLENEADFARIVASHHAPRAAHR